MRYIFEYDSLQTIYILIPLYWTLNHNITEYYKSLYSSFRFHNGFSLPEKWFKLFSKTY